MTCAQDYIPRNVAELMIVFLVRPATFDGTEYAVSDRGCNCCIIKLTQCPCKEESQNIWYCDEVHAPFSPLVLWRIWEQ